MNGNRNRNDNRKKEIRILYTPHLRIFNLLLMREFELSNSLFQRRRFVVNGTFWCTSMTRLGSFGFSSFSLRTPLFDIGKFGWGNTEKDPRLMLSATVQVAETMTYGCTRGYRSTSSSAHGLNTNLEGS
jgi:hypothetical protein